MYEVTYDVYFSVCFDLVYQTHHFYYEKMGICSNKLYEISEEMWNDEVNFLETTPPILAPSQVDDP